MSKPFEETVARQIEAAAPETSAWVSANAGSGKTRVLTNRVARLLLAGADPSRILCITYTKAAAAEMAERLFTLLGKWALMDNTHLADELFKLEGEQTPKRSGEDLSKARKLFAQALETPGGLKIQTIHAFCSHVLKRFPLEAGVPPGFGEIEEGEASLLLDEAIDMIAHEGVVNQDIADALSHLGLTLGAQQTIQLLKRFINQRQQYHAMVGHWGDTQTMLNQLAEKMKTKPGKTEEEVILDVLKHFPTSEIQSVAEALKIGTKTDIKNAQLLADTVQTDDAVYKYKLLCSYFLTQKNTPRSKLATKEVNIAFPPLEERLQTIQEYFTASIPQINAVKILKDTTSFIRIAELLMSKYARLKWSKGVLDFDDLILATQTLFQHADHAAKWVMYKLDNGLEHILIDEAQDTSPGQWNVVEGALAEFFSDTGTRVQNRTLFVVGDEKQSIYSFQGADASLFGEKSQNLGKQVSQATAFKNIPLTLSFRSTAPVLNFVDAVFADKTAMEGMGETDTLRHGIRRSDEAGLVEVWPLTPKPEKPLTNPWDAPLDAISASNPAVQLCNHIAQTIASWLGKEKLASQDRLITASDIIILVQKRSVLFKQMIKSLSKYQVPIAGADRLSLLSDIAIQDLLSYGRCILLSEDDLSLAELLKSPFFGIDEENLFSLAYDRKGSLWNTLCKRQHEHPQWEAAVQEISIARKIALKYGPYDFYSWVLDQYTDKVYNQTGRQRLYSRLGTACSDSLDAFLHQLLEFEANHPRNLQGYITWFEENARIIKREQDQTSDAVRIMTVHGAKGLEGNIVFLLDAHQKPAINKSGPIWDISSSETLDPAPKLPALVRLKEVHIDATQAAKEEVKRKQFEEYRRLFYVAATRAKDRLYVCGLERKQSSETSSPHNEDSWHALAQKGVEHLQEQKTALTPLTSFPWEGQGWQLSSPQNKTIETSPPSHGATIKIEPLPSWLTQDCPSEDTTEQLTPSALADYHEDLALPDSPQPQGQSGNKPIGYSPISQEARFLRGRTLHRLLEILPDYPHANRKQIADKLLSRLAPDIASSIREQWREEVFAVLDHPDFTAVFAPGSRAEVNIGGTPDGARDNIIINGQIDRLSVNADEILIVDYKTNQPPPQCEEDVADAYLAQMAAYRGLIQPLYPDKKIKTGLIWTYEAKLMILSDKLLDHAFSRFLT